MALRVIHRFGGEPADVSSLVAYTQQARVEPGCLEAECYHGLAGAQVVAVVELWTDEDAFGRAWGTSLDSGRADLLFGHGLPMTEFYPHQSYDQLDGVWVPDGISLGDVRIFWPANGSVRVAIQTAMPDIAAATPGLVANQAETRREPGCVHFEWMQSAEFEHHVLLLELWQNQALYDSHWALRLKTMPAGPPPPPAERLHGANGSEFYRYSAFNHLYDRWLPAHPSRWATTVVWPQ